MSVAVADPSPRPRLVARDLQNLLFYVLAGPVIGLMASAHGSIPSQADLFGLAFMVGGGPALTCVVLTSVAARRVAGKGLRIFLSLPIGAVSGVLGILPFAAVFLHFDFSTETFSILRILLMLATFYSIAASLVCTAVMEWLASPWPWHGRLV